ncbi:glycosyltransferase family 2 protein [Plastorhodobacter daqingensis]|uniref:Glycosyltransferase family 2 protein n=1 Tax=Plastorhodobacter daqingensis TaxID=1387281 RepID=A0ABW2UMC8_9RHOB
MTLIVIAMCTLGRPQMLKAALASLVVQEVPEGTRLRLLVVENAPELSIQPVLDAFPGAGIVAVTEPQRGIAAARNRALETALEMGADWIAFIDDDEEAHPDWIARLYAGATQRDLDLAGGIVWPKLPGGALNITQKMVFDGLQFRAARSHRRHVRRIARGGDATDLYATSNWLCRATRLHEDGLRFDVRLAAGGGEDMLFSQQAIGRGWRLGRILDAVVEETVPQARLLPAYVFQRARDAERSHFQAGFTKASRGRHAMRTTVYAFGRGFRGVANLLAIPVLGGRGLVEGLSALGAALGRIEGFFGRKSERYRRIEGS